VTGPSAAVAVLAAGSGTRVGATVNKILLPLVDRPVLAWSVGAALDAAEVSVVVVVCRPGERTIVGEALAPYLGEREVLLINGGSTRHASEQAALDVLADRIADGSIDVLAIHDGARPLAAPALFDAVIATARAYGGAVPTVDLPGLAPRANAIVPVGLVGVQTPQAFRASDLAAAYAAARADGFEGTDTAASVERYTDLVIRAVPTGPENLKVTYAEDLSAATALLETRPGA
jgi:2-C-methyl-D-erythritol 4-phosphate cytidylyltransferase